VSSLLTVGIYFFFPTEFYPVYLVAYVFWMTIILGALFLTLLDHVSNALWSIALRRITESLAVTVPVMAVLFLPICFGISNLYYWSNAESVAGDNLLPVQSGYLDVSFFIIRSLLYFIIWTVLALILYRTSLKQDQNHTPAREKIFRLVSAPGIILFAITFTFAAFDWLMSLDPQGYSTVFGLYIFTGSFLSTLAFIILIGLFLRRQNLLRDVIGIEHYHMLAKLMFWFVLIWAYLAFTQYFLIWYAKMSEPTIFFRHRWEGSWKYISLLLVFGQFLIPFLGLMTRTARRNPTFLFIISVWILLMHFFDLYWMVMPNFMVYDFYLSAIDLIIFLSIGGIFISTFSYIYFRKALVPLNNPDLKAFGNPVNR
jgi:hypothetical protein